jgi:hypothetical protein
VVPAIVACVAVSLALAQAQAQSPAPVPEPITDSARIERLERLVATMVEENRRLAEEVRALKAREVDPTPVLPSPTPPAVELPLADVPADSVPPSDPTDVPETRIPIQPSPGVAEPALRPAGRFRVDYENGFAILPENLDDTPFSLRIRSQNMFRYNGFGRSERFWTNSAGDRLPIDSSNYFGIPRGRLIFSGTALLPKLTYLLNIDYNSVTSNPIGFRAYVLSYPFGRGLELSFGQSKVPGTREWLESAFAPLQGPDRTMATTFFRPSLSQGVWITGEPVEGWYYHAMVSNGFNTLNQLPNRLNNRFCWSGSTWWEPWGDFGRGYSDLQDHEEAAIRIGGSGTYALGRGSQSESDAVENSPIRLSDGTLITTLGALAPGVTLQTYDIALAAFDLSYKYRGLGLSTELYLQRLLNLEGDGPLPLHETGAFGGFVQGGYFVLPQTAELYVRGSFVTGAYGSGSEVAGGFNWFFLKGRDNLRFTFDLTWLESSPAGQNRTGFVAGQSGLLLRTQILAVY